MPDTHLSKECIKNKNKKKQVSTYTSYIYTYARLCVDMLLLIYTDIHGETGCNGSVLFLV